MLADTYGCDCGWCARTSDWFPLHQRSMDVTDGVADANRQCGRRRMLQKWLLFVLPNRGGPSCVFQGRPPALVLGALCLEHLDAARLSAALPPCRLAPQESYVV